MKRFIEKYKGYRYVLFTYADDGLSIAAYDENEFNYDKVRATIINDYKYQFIIEEGRLDENTCIENIETCQYLIDCCVLVHSGGKCSMRTYMVSTNKFYFKNCVINGRY